MYNLHKQERSKYSFESIAKEYDVFIFDVLGTLYDLKDPFPEVKELLQNLKKEGKTIIVLSNSPVQQKVSKERLIRLGFPESLFDKIITSGMVAKKTIPDFLKTVHLDSKTLNRRPRAFFIGTAAHMEIFADHVDQTHDICTADFIFNSADPGVFSDGWEIKYNSIFKQGIEKGKPMFCANPDQSAVNSKNEFLLVAGTLADLYKKNGGTVIFSGKPYKDVYDEIFEFLKERFPEQKERLKMVAIGDSIRHDILGAKNTGIDSILVYTGVSYAEAMRDNMEKLSLKNLKKLCAKDNVGLPTFIAKKLSWNNKHIQRVGG